MQRFMLRSKIHRATLTGTELDYEGSIAIDQDLIAAAICCPASRSMCSNLSNATRLITYVIPHARRRGHDGCSTALPPTRCAVGDKVVILAYAALDGRRSPPTETDRRPRQPQDGIVLKQVDFCWERPLCRSGTHGRDATNQERRGGRCPLQRGETILPPQMLELLMEPMFLKLGIASVLLGLLVGLQREHAANGMAGIGHLPAHHGAGQPRGPAGRPLS